MLRQEMRNQELWMQGLYINNALQTQLYNFGQGMSKHRKPPKSYIKQPIRITPLSEAEKRQKILQERKKAIAYFTNLQKMWEERGEANA